MAFTTDDLLNLGLTKEQAQEVFALRGKEINAEKEQLEKVTQERDALQKRVDGHQAELDKLMSAESNNAETQKALTALQAEFDKHKVDAAAELAHVTKVHAINLALRDTSAHKPEALMKFLDVDKVELDDQGKPQLDDFINGLKESDPYLFKPENQQVNQSLFVSGNPSASDTGQSDPFQAIIDGYK
ncbi:TPA: phage scaffolding protein [Streptococcus suis]|nr:phage scaffolding protein [Streptococcus suis]